MTLAWLRPVVIIAGVAVLLSLNAREFKEKRRVLAASFAAAPSDDAALALARAQAFQTLSIEQLLHMIHTMLAAILVSLLWHAA